MDKVIKEREELVNLNRIDLLLTRYCSKNCINSLNAKKILIEYPAGTEIFREGEEVQGMHIIEKGKAKVFSTWKKDKTRIVRIASDGFVLGHRGLGKDFVYPVSAITLERTSVWYIPLKTFQETLQQNSMFSYYFMLFMIEELRRTEEWMRDLSFLTVKQRIAKAILQNAIIFGFDPVDKQKLSLTLSRKDFADFTSTTYETVIRVLSDLDKQGIIEIVGKALRITDFDKLRTVIDEG